ncbi:MAG TPA: oligosaccharide flippase family protein [Panacibacter sp.]|nr:oligosaccharide flippase family protein [Panacibacter sp.]
MNLKIYLKNTFLRNVFVVMFGTAIAQAIPVLISPLLTRIYSPSDFAVFSLYLSVLNTLSIIITGRYELAIILPKYEKAALIILKISLFITAILSFVFFIFFIFFSNSLAQLLGNNNISRWLLVLPLSLLLTGVFQSLSYWLTKEKNYTAISKTRLIQSLTGVLFTILLGFIPIISGGLVFGNIIGLLIAVIFSVIIIYPSIKKNFWDSSKSKLKLYALKYIDFPKYNAFSSLVNAIGIYIPLWYISSVFNAETTGYYGLATRIIAIPLMLFSSSVSQVYYKKAADIFNSKQDLYKFTKNLFLKCLSIAILPLMILVFLAPYLFNIVFGAKWYEAGRMSQYIAVGIFVQVIISPFTGVFAIIDKLKVVMIWQFLYLVSNVVFIYINQLFFKNALTSYLLLYSLMNILLYSIYLFMILNQLKKISYA